MYTHQRCSARSGTCVRRVADFAARKSEEKRHWRIAWSMRGVDGKERTTRWHGRDEKREKGSMMTGTKALPREVGPLRSVTSRRNGAAFVVSKLAADWPREMMAGALANRLPAVPSSPVCRSGTVPALYLNVGRD